MKYLPLVWAGLVRKPARTILTLFSVAMAFLLFGMLQGVNSGFASVIEKQRLDRLLTDTRVPGGAPMPISALAQIEGLPGVRRVAARAGFYGYYRDPKEGSIGAIATDVPAWFAVWPENKISTAQLAAMTTTRTGILMTSALRDYLKLKIGDKVPIHSPIERRDGEAVWTFDLVGTFDDPEDQSPNYLAVIHYAYFDEARIQNRGTVGRFIVRIADPTRSAQTAAAIDGLFANSAHETRTQNQKEVTESSIRQVGDVNYLTNAVLSAVFFSLLFLTTNTLAQSIRERIPEFAVLKTIGFSDRGVFALVFAESGLLCVVSAAVGLSLAAVLFPSLRDFVGISHLSWKVIGLGLAMALLVALLSAAVPAWSVKRLRIIDALAR